MYYVVFAAEANLGVAYMRNKACFFAHSLRNRFIRMVRLDNALCETHCEKGARFHLDEEDMEC